MASLLLLKITNVSANGLSAQWPIVTKTAYLTVIYFKKKERI